jgi:serine/threonine protein kinase
MSTLADDPLDLQQDQWRDLQDRISQLEKEMQAGALTVDLGRFLPPLGALHRRTVLCELIKTQLEARYRNRRGCLLEEYCRLYPELGKPEALSAGLIYEEYRVRTMVGEGPSLEEYRDRFPRQFEKLQRQVQRQKMQRTSASSSGTIRPDPVPSQDAPSSMTPAGQAQTPPPPLSPTPLPGAARVPRPSLPAGPPLGSDSSQLLPGYEVLECIGKGAFGAVYRARAPGGILVAIKRLFRPLDDASSQKELQALEKLKELRHPYLLQMHSVHAIDGHLNMVMELADGSLEDRCKECRKLGLPGIPAQELLHYFAEAAEALDFLCRENLCHRDIKPQNLLHLKSHAKIADFGIARVQVNSVDQTMNTLGTPAYMPPEAWTNAVSKHSDQYSFAIAWYEMRTHCLPFPSKNFLDLGMEHRYKQPDLLGVPEPEQQILVRALAKNPDERFPSCVEFVQALRDACLPPAPPPPPPGFGVKVAMGLLAFALAAVLIALFWPRPETEKPEIKLPEKKKHVPAPKDTPITPPNWLPDGDDTMLVEGRLYYKRLKRELGPHTVVMVLVPKGHSQAPHTFYIMENRVTNDQYAIFMADPKSRVLFAKYREKVNCQDFVSTRRTLTLWEWRKGGWSYKENIEGPDMPPFLGVEGDKGSFPVFRVKVTEAHCFAEWLGGKLPLKKQWFYAAGKDQGSNAPGPYFGPRISKEDAVVGLKDGPRSVTWGGNHVSIHGCRQMAGNGYEWTRNLTVSAEHIPLEEALNPNSVHVEIVGQTYAPGATAQPLTFDAMNTPRDHPCSKGDFDIGFRVVLEP